MRANSITGLKVCSMCHVEQPVSNFTAYSLSRDGLHCYCKSCKNIKQREFRQKNPEYGRLKHAEYRRRNPDALKTPAAREYNRLRAAKLRLKNPGLSRRYRYNLTSEKEAEFKVSQQNKCPGCLRDFSITADYVDHDHATGKVRGLLCMNCNVAIGHLRDDSAILLRLAAYLNAAKSANL
jgi:Recombination endonuclease VII